jgi:glucan phosphoethanolaminetransferase (alkaline phosphatase superfamily)
VSSFIKIISCLVISCLHFPDFYSRIEQGFYVKDFTGGLLYGLVLSFLHLMIIAATFIVAFHPRKKIRISLSLLFLISLIFVHISKNIAGSFDFSVVEGTLVFVIAELKNLNISKNFVGFFPSSFYLEALLILCLLASFILPSKTKINYLYANLFLVATGSLLLTLSIFSGVNSIRGLPPHFTAGVWLSHISLSKIFADNDHDSVAIKLNDQTKKNNIVFFVDESVRGDYLDINNNQNITPSLFVKKNEIINFGIASSGANDSAKSNQILRTGPKKSDYQQGLYKNPFIWSYMKQAGYKTVYVDCQYDIPFNNGMTAREFKDVDQFYHPPSSDKDLESLEFVKDLLSKTSVKPLFIYFVKYGVHYPYSYPKEKEKYPVVNLSFDKITKQDLINHYKNAVLAKIDPFFKKMFELPRENSVLIYTSDHGQNLLDNGRLISHGSVENTVPGEGTVPLFILTSVSKWQKKFRNNLVYNKNKVSHFNIFSTLLNIAGYDEQEVRQKHGKSLFDKVNDSQTFATGCCLLPRKIGRASAPIWVSIAKDKLANVSG